MPNCLRKLVFTYIGPLVGIKNKSSVTESPRKGKNRNGSSNNFELKSLKLIQNENLENELNDCENNVRESHILDDREPTDRTDENRPILPNEVDEMESNSMEWQRAAQVLDRFILVIAVILSMLTFGAIFIQAPRVRQGLLGTTTKSLEEDFNLWSK